jgi:hypothetical protein
MDRTTRRKIEVTRQLLFMLPVPHGLGDDTKAQMEVQI